MVGYCQQCGRSMSEIAEFCGACGSRSGEPHASPSAIRPSGHPARGLMLGAAAALLIGGAAAAMLSGAIAFPRQAQGADRDGDGVISNKEAVYELAMFRLSDPLAKGQWSIQTSGRKSERDGVWKVVNESVEQALSDENYRFGIAQFIGLLPTAVPDIEDAEKIVNQGVRLNDNPPCRYKELTIIGGEVRIEFSCSIPDRNGNVTPVEGQASGSYKQTEFSLDVRRKISAAGRNERSELRVTGRLN